MVLQPKDFSYTIYGLPRVIFLIIEIALAVQNEGVSHSLYDLTRTTKRRAIETNSIHPLGPYSVQSVAAA